LYDGLAQTLSKFNTKTTLLIVSDHGFSPFTREFHLSSWLVENGYATLNDPTRRGDDEFFDNVNWAKTKAYALGLNGFYINVRGRDCYGTVRPSKARELATEIARKLEDYRDPLNGWQIVTKAFQPKEIYSGKYANTAPDLILGYNRGYRISDEAVLGTFPKDVVGYRKDKWAADHCMDSRVVPGVLLTNRRVIANHPGLEDMAPTILNEFGIESPSEMHGQNVFEELKG
jgi:predicted AlkP superfamily phosphohydrolase/phosphomutase